MSEIKTILAGLTLNELIMFRASVEREIAERIDADRRERRRARTSIPQWKLDVLANRVRLGFEEAKRNG